MKTEWNTRIVGALLLIMSVMFGGVQEKAIAAVLSKVYYTESGVLMVKLICKGTGACPCYTSEATGQKTCLQAGQTKKTRRREADEWPARISDLGLKLSDDVYQERIASVVSDHPYNDDILYYAATSDMALTSTLAVVGVPIEVPLPSEDIVSSFDNDWIIDLNGYTMVQESAGMLFRNNERIQGNGKIQATRTINNTEGHISPGNSAGSIAFEGNFENQGILLMELAGADNTQYDTISVTETAQLGGCLKINLVDGFVPSNSEAYHILSADGAITGDFDWVSAPSEYAWEVSATPTAFTVTCKTHVPVAEAGEDISITCNRRSSTSIAGRATDAGSEASLTYQWFEENKDAAGTITLSPLMDPASSARQGDYYPCPLPAAKIATLSLGSHTLDLVIHDSEESYDVDSMILTITNNPPVIGILKGPGVYKIGSDVLLSADVQDLDGDSVSYAWKDGANELFAGTKSTKCCGLMTFLPDQSFSTLGLGTHTLCLNVKDGTNAIASACFTVEVIDTEAPKLAPEILGTAILWPAVHVMVPVTILAHASDNSGALASLKVSVTSNEPASGTGKYDLSPDYKVLSVNKATGVIMLLLRAESSPSGSGRQYTIAIQAKDISGNVSAASVVVRVPREKPVICCQ